MKTSFTTKLLGFGNNTGIKVPAESIARLGTSKKPPVNVDVNGYKYKSTVAVMHGNFMISFPKANRELTGLKAGDEIKVVLELDEGVREVEVPQALGAALEKAQLTEAFAKLSYSKRKEFARQVNEAKAEDTRNRRIEKIVAILKDS